MTEGTRPYASVIVPTRNGMPLVEQCLRAILDQETPWPFEVILIDSESTDGTWELACSLPIDARRIPVREFNHGATRNLAAELARGEYLVFMVQDAVPFDRNWLLRLVEAAEGEGVAGSYSMQLAWPHDSPLVRQRIAAVMPSSERRIEQRLDPGIRWEALSPEVQFRLATFHNNSSCIRRRVWREHPFRPLRYGEDLDWGARAVQAGHTIVFEPRSLVFHSHDRPAWYEFKRAYADHMLVVHLFGYQVYPSLAHLGEIWLKATVSSVRWIARQPEPLSGKCRSAIQSPVLFAAQLVGAALGSRIAGLDERVQTSRPLRRLDTILRRGV